MTWLVYQYNEDDYLLLMVWSMTSVFQISSLHVNKEKLLIYSASHVYMYLLAVWKLKSKVVFIVFINTTMTFIVFINLLASGKPQAPWKTKIRTTLKIIRLFIKKNIVFCKTLNSYFIWHGLIFPISPVRAYRVLAGHKDSKNFSKKKNS